MAVISATPAPVSFPVSAFAEPPQRRAVDVQTNRPTEDSRESDNDKDQDVVIVEQREEKRQAGADDEDTREIRDERRRVDIRV